MKFLLFIAAVIALGVITIRLKRKNNKTRHDALVQLGEMLLNDEPQTAQPVQQTQPAEKAGDTGTDETYVPRAEQDLATLVIPDDLPFAEEIRVLKYMAEKYPDEISVCLYEPAGEITISLFEQRMGIRLPDELRALYAFANGMDLCGTTLYFDSLQTVEKYCNMGYCYFKEEGDENDYLVIGSVIGDGESILLEKKTGDLLWYDEGEVTNYKDVVSLLNWLIEFEFEGYIDNDDPYITAYLKGRD